MFISLSLRWGSVTHTPRTNNGTYSRPWFCISQKPFAGPRGMINSGRSLSRRLRCAVADQAVEMHPDVGGFRRGIGERDGAVEGDAGLVIAAELHQKCAFRAEEVEIIRKPPRHPLHPRRRRPRAAHPCDSHPAR